MSLTHHDGISVTGSGLAFGKKYSEQVMIDCSGNTTSSLHIQAKSLDSILALGSNTGIRFDGGSFGHSGMLETNYSTRLSSILFAMAVPVYPTTGLAALASGFVNNVGVAFSGNQLDFTMLTGISGGLLGGGLTSAGTSSKIAFFCAGT